MKRIFSVLLSVMMIVTFTSCGREAIVEEETSETIIGGGPNGQTVSGDGSEVTSADGKATEVSEGTSGSTKPVETQKATLTLSHWISGGTTEKTSVSTVLEQFKKDYPNITVKVNFISGDYSTKMYANLSAGKESDVFMVADGDFGKWVKAGVLEDLTPYVKKSKNVDLSQIWASAVSRYSYNGSSIGTGDIYVMPKDISPRALFYNKDLLKKYGVNEPSKTEPMTYDQFAAFLQQVAHPNDGVWGIPTLNWEGMIRSSGASLLSADKKSSNLSDPKIVSSFQKLSDLIHVYNVIPKSSQLDSGGAFILFQTQKAVCFDGATYNIISARDFDFDWDVCPLPTDGSDKYNTGYTGSVGYAVSKRGKNKDLAYLLAEYFTTRKAQTILSQIGFNIPLYKDMANSSVFLSKDKKPENSAAFIKAAEYQQPIDMVYTDNDQWYSVLGNRLQPLWNDPSVKASTLLPSIKPEIDRLLK